MRGRAIPLSNRLIVVLAILFAACGRSDPTLPAAATEPPVSNQTQVKELNGFFFGTSLDRFGELAWYLRLDTRSGTGSLYTGPGAVGLSQVKLDSTGHLEFRSDPISGEMAYEFSGRLSDAGIHGVIRSYAPDRSDLEERRFDLDLTRILPTEANTSHSGRIAAGVYTNVQYIAEAGDLVGKELVLFETPQGTTGFLAIYEGAPIGNFALSHVKYDDKTLRFSIQTGDGLEEYRASVTAAKLTLQRIDTAGVGLEKLVRGGSAAALLKAEAKGPR